MNIFAFVFVLGLTTQAACAAATAQSPAADATSQASIIKKITVKGNKFIKSEAILRCLPYSVGSGFDESKSDVAIRNLYDLGCFSQIILEKDETDEGLEIIITVTEKKLLEKIEIKGNKAVPTKDIREKLGLDKITAIDDETMRRISVGIKKLYVEENRHNVNVNYEIVPSADNPDKASALITISDGPKSTVRRVFFEGNENIPSRKLADFCATREAWLLGFMDGAGSYKQDLVEQDKQRIEYFYRDHGFLMAKVAKADVQFSKNHKDITVTYKIKEGNRFKVKKIDIQSDELFEKDELLPHIMLEEGNYFSQSLMVQTINRIKDLYGEQGYIYADVYPHVVPDEKTNTVTVTFMLDRGTKLTARTISITGNKVTHDKVIRRQLDINEGELITTQKLRRSENGVEYLTYFERDGVNWKIHKISDNEADLEMNVKEAKTGNFNFMLTYGTDQNNPRPSLRGAITLEKGNLFGRGWDIGGMVQADRHRLRKLEAHFFDPHVFDSNVSVATTIYKRWDEYDQWQLTQEIPRQRVYGGNIRIGVTLPEYIDKRMQLVFDLGVEDIRNNNPKARLGYEEAQPIISRTFQRGSLKWIGLELVKDTRNHQVYPSEGYRVITSIRSAPPGLNREFSMLKGEVEGSFYTALIGQDTLVLGMHGKMGTMGALKRSQPIPYKELYHMGGQGTVRGFTWGGIGPAWSTGDPLGGRNALQFNSELIFPLIPDYSMKAHVFYDAGAGWNTPKDDINDVRKIRRDKLDLRHSVGFGLNLLKPMPAKIDWGFKLDRKKHLGESASEFHLSMNYAW